MKIEIMQELESLKQLMEKNAQEEEMDFEEFCENAVFDTDPDFSDAITEIALKMLGIDSDEDYDSDVFGSEEYDNVLQEIYDTLTAGCEPNARRMR